MKTLLQNEYIDMGDGELLTVTQQFYYPKHFDIGYNSYWYPDYPPITHSLFIDLDDTPLTEIKTKILPTLTQIISEARLLETRIGVVLQTSKNNHHIVIPSSFSWPQVLFILSAIGLEHKKPGLIDYLRNSVSRGYCTLRLSPKIFPVQVIESFTFKGERMAETNPNHYGLILSLARKKNKKVYNDLKRLEKHMPMVDNTTDDILTYYSHGDIAKLEVEPLRKLSRL